MSAQSWGAGPADWEVLLSLMPRMLQEAGRQKNCCNFGALTPRELPPELVLTLQKLWRTDSWFEALWIVPHLKNQGLEEILRPMLREKLLKATSLDEKEVALRAIGILEFKDMKDLVLEHTSKSNYPIFQIRNVAFDVLSDWRDPDAMPLLRATINENDSRWNRTALDYLAKYDDKNAVTDVAIKLANDQPKAIKILKERLAAGDVQDRPLIIEALRKVAQNKSGKEQFEAAKSLAEDGDEVGIATIRDLASTPGSMRTRAVKAYAPFLDRENDVSANFVATARILADAHQLINLGEKSGEEFAREVLSVLMKSHSPGSQILLQAALKSTQMSKIALEIYGAIPTPQATKEVEIQRYREKAKNGNEDAIDELARLGDVASLPIFVDQLKNKYVTIKWAAIRAIRKLGSKDQVKDLLPLMDPKKEDERNVRHLAAQAVFELLGSGAKDALQASLVAEKEDFNRDYLMALVGVSKLDSCPKGPFPSYEKLKNEITKPDEVYFKGRYYPRKKVSEIHFRTDDPPRQHGGSCHVFAAVALFEEACHRKTGKHVNVSEAYLFYRHLRSTMEQGAMPRLSRPETGYFTDFDGGFSDFTFSRIANKSVCTEQDDKDFWGFIEQTFKDDRKKFKEEFEKKRDEINKNCNWWSIGTGSKINSAEAQQEKEFRDSVCAKLDSYVSLRLGGTPTDSGGVAVTPNDQALAKCVRDLGKPLLAPFDESLALMLLAQGIPFACSGDFTYHQGTNSSGGSHIAVVNGYRFQDNPEIPFKVIMRDSNFGRDDFVSTTAKCKTMHYYP